jgi:outer membrane receptor protein involved in Fe transport
VYINCAAEGLAPGFLQHNGVQVNSAGGAELGLRSEDSQAWTAGFVLQPVLPQEAGKLSLAVDWWRIDVANQVAQIGAENLLDLCYSDPDFRAGASYCNYSTRDVNGDLAVDDNFINIARQVAEGMDFNVRYTRGVGPGRFTADVRATRYSDQKNRLLPGDLMDELNGTITAPKWVGDLDLGYTWRNWSGYYGLVFVGAQDSNAYYGIDPAVDPYDYRASAYLQHNLSARYTGASDWEVVLGVRNLTDVAPRTITPGQYANRAGNSFIYSAYDYFGRRAYLTLTKSF